MMDTDTEEIVQHWDLNTLQRWHFKHEGGKAFLAWINRRLGIEPGEKGFITSISRDGDRISVTRYEQPYRVVRCGESYAHAAQYTTHFDLEGDEPAVWPPGPTCPACDKPEHPEPCS